MPRRRASAFPNQENGFYPASKSVTFVVQIQYSLDWKNTSGDEATGCRLSIQFDLDQKMNSQADWEDLALNTLSRFQMWKVFAEEQGIQYDDALKCCFMRRVERKRGKSGELSQLAPGDYWTTVRDLFANQFELNDVLYLWVPVERVPAYEDGDAVSNDGYTVNEDDDAVSNDGHTVNEDGDAVSNDGHTVNEDGDTVSEQRSSPPSPAKTSYNGDSNRSRRITAAETVATDDEDTNE